MHMCMVVKQNKANIDGVKSLHNYLYALTEPNYELLEIYHQIDEEVDEIETEIAEMQDEVSAEEQLEDMKNELYALVADIDKCKLSPEAITEEIKRILF
ncbi:hypothetical protein PQE72_gp048 [Bacillus phage vB_BanS_Skywalker]|uniref:Uncharacterized protein n=3 Tax=Caudoviricetes TaxID=2731619 RepID=A0AAE8YV75_9CAUD|nr:hypothetical protein PQE72_gp048 [Bacillus phage vB_BanS_Skywalker]YP_010680916.1 hypothetical protein PQE73_gp020 [Bacillus phage vB_BanS_MrDarsey]UGO47852.1 hypothetical protein MRDARSEY_20 [Bacillus phage vB_BanS_MrDarsey]UGO51395.1 hypothetical protein SKYWALKER_238 [Bacillus phage vB_BanS_Skywalker]